jgi:sec1 family domain-containing protein 1
MAYSIREKQIDALKQMLNFNQPLSTNKLMLNEPSWKILIYDRYGQDILSPLFGIKQLRDNGVTLNL